MASKFATDFAPSLARLADRFGEADCTYTGPGDGVALSGLTLRINREAPQRQIDASGRITFMSQTAQIIAEVTVIPNPVHDGRITVGTEVWTINGRPLLSNGKYICSCVRSSAERVGEKRSRNA